MDPEQRLRRDARSLAGDPEAAALFECLVEHRFDPALDTTFMGRVCGAPRAVRDRLAAKIGPLKDYLTRLRMTEAKHLVCETQVPIGEIGKRVGYTVKRTFRRAFTTAFGVSPSAMRQKARAAGDDGDDAGAPKETQTPEPQGNTEAPSTSSPADEEERLTRRALAARLKRQRSLGMLDLAAATELRFKLRRRYPQLDKYEAAASAEAETHPPQQPPEAPLWPVVLTPTGDWLEEIAANSAIGEILDMPEEDQRFALVRGLRMGNGAHTAHREDLTALGPLARAAPFTTVSASELDRAEGVLRRLEPQPRIEILGYLSAALRAETCGCNALARNAAQG